jgi:hypothetical protein
VERVSVKRVEEAGRECEAEGRERSGKAGIEKKEEEEEQERYL